MQVYIYEHLEQIWLPRSDKRHDPRHMRHSPYRLVGHPDLGEADYGRMAELYALLYLEQIFPPQSRAFNELLYAFVTPPG